tara:strand:- start:464 stop:982 length:519 start_codon:yes stop_codon:yes gene_type:complete
MLGYDNTGKLVRINEAVKENIKVYLSQYRMMTDAVQLKDAWICNISVDFAILTKKGFNKNEVLLRCIDRLKFYFSINKWQINQPIILADVASEIVSVEGVATVVNPPNQNPNEEQRLVVIKNKSGSADGYSDNLYNIAAATFNGVVYPAVDPTIFEVKYLDTDIQGRVMGDI